MIKICTLTMRVGLPWRGFCYPDEQTRKLQKLFPFIKFAVIHGGVLIHLD